MTTYMKTLILCKLRQKVQPFWPDTLSGAPLIIPQIQSVYLDPTCQTEKTRDHYEEILSLHKSVKNDKIYINLATF